MHVYSDPMSLYSMGLLSSDREMGNLQKLGSVGSVMEEVKLVTIFM